MAAKTLRPLTRPGASLAAVAVAATLLGGCAGMQDRDMTHAVTVSAEKRAQAETVYFNHAVVFPADGARPYAREIDRLGRFVDRIRPNVTDRIVVATNPASDDKVTARRLALIGKALRERGLEPESRRMADVGEGGGQPPGVDEVVIQVERYAVRVPGCPDWSRPTIGGFSNLPSSNFGCANQVNLALMVDDPRDLVHGRERRWADGELTASAITRYRAGKDGKPEASTQEPIQIMMTPPPTGE